MKVEGNAHNEVNEKSISVTEDRMDVFHLLHKRLLRYEVTMLHS